VPKSIWSINNKSREEKNKKEETKKVLNVKIWVERNTVVNRSKPEWVV